MHLDDGRVQFYGLDLEAHDLLPLQLFKDAIQYAVLGPAIHASVEGVPVAKTLRQSAPLAPLLGYIQQRVEHLQVGKTDIASLAWKARLDTKILRLGDFHEPKHTTQSHLVLTGPRLAEKQPVMERISTDTEMTGRRKGVAWNQTLSKHRTVRAASGGIATRTSTGS